MTKRLLDVGNCGPDHSAIREMVQTHFDVQVDQAHGLDGALAALQQASYDLVTINRQMDADGSEGLEIIKAMQADPQYSDVPAMLITNYPDHAQLAVDAGAVPGFGKLSLHKPETLERFRAYLA